MADTKVYSIRADEEVVSQLKEVTEQFPNASEAFRSLLAAHEMSRAKEVLKGQETSIDDFQAHADALVRAYISSLDLTAGTEQRIRQEFVERLESKDKTIADLQKRTEDAERIAKEATATVSEVEQRAAERDEEANRQLSEYIAKTEQAQKAQLQAEENARIAEQARKEIEGHLEAMREQRAEARADKEKAQARSSELEAQISAVQKELAQMQSELVQEKAAHAADKNAAEIAKAQAETAKIQAISEERERLNAEYKDMQTQMQTKIDKLYEQNSTLQAQIQALRTTE